MSHNSLSRWKQWIQPNRLIPLLTILGAGTAIVLSFIGIITLSIAENIVIALLALFATDALTERLSVLERIEEKISHLSTGQTLKSRTEIPSVEGQAGYASEICIIAVSGITLSIRYLGFFERKMKDGCKIRIILLDPNSPSLDTLNLINTFRTTDSDIESGLEVFRPLARMDSLKGSIEIRLSEAFIPFSIFGVDLQKESGSMVVEFHAYKRAPGDRPHVFLNPRDDRKWFDYYRQQFERAWSDATVWTP